MVWRLKYIVRRLRYSGRDRLSLSGRVYRRSNELVKHVARAFIVLLLFSAAAGVAGCLV